MTEDKIEGFEDFDSILGEAQDEAGGAEGEFGGELDQLLGGEAGGEEAPAGGGEGDSELDSFFEDLSTIDDLEVLQEEAPAPAPEPAEGEELEEAAPEPAEAPAAAAPARAAERPRAPARPKKRGFLGRLIRWLILLGILFGGGYYLYQFFYPDLQPPWQVIQEEKGKLTSSLSEKMRKPLPVAPPPAPAPRPAPVRPRPVPEHGPWSIQVATCFFPSCMESFRGYLQAQKRSVLVRSKASRSESLEIYSVATWRERDDAQALADKINRESPLEGHAFIFREDGGFRISMGVFADLARANIVKDALNQQYEGAASFATRVKAFPYKLQTVLTGRFPTRRKAERALAALKDAEPRLKDAFVTRN